MAIEAQIATKATLLFRSERKEAHELIAQLNNMITVDQAQTETLPAGKTRKITGWNYVADISNDRPSRHSALL